MSRWIKTHIGWVRIGIVALAILVGGPALAQDSTQITIEPLIGASFGSIQRGVNPGVSRVSYWGGLFVKQIVPGIRLYSLYQQTKLDDLNLTGKGGKALVSVTHLDCPELALLIGGGFLSGFALDGDGSRTTALTLDLGLNYEWYNAFGVEVYLGVLGSAVDYGPRFDYSIDFGPLLRF